MRITKYLSLSLLLVSGVVFADPAVNIDCLESNPPPPPGATYRLPLGNCAIRLKTSAIIGATVSGDTLYQFSSDGVVKFPLEYVNRDTNSYAVGNGFVVYSPDGATWEHATANGGNVHGLPATMFGIWIDSTGYYPKPDFGGIYHFNLWGADGAGRDTCTFGGTPNDVSQLGLRPSDSGIFFYIVIHPKLSDVGKHICIDSATNTPPTCTWKWPSVNYIPSFNASPTWQGGCFVIGGCCQGHTGNADCSPDNVVDIADIAAMVSRYTTFAPPCCPAASNVDGSADGSVDIADLVALIEYLFINFRPPAPCQ